MRTTSAASSERYAGYRPRSCARKVKMASRRRHCDHPQWKAHAFEVHVKILRVGVVTGGVVGSRRIGREVVEALGTTRERLGVTRVIPRHRLRGDGEGGGGPGGGIRPQEGEDVGGAGLERNVIELGVEGSERGV